MACEIALDAVKTVYMEERGRKEIDIKRYAKVRTRRTRKIWVWISEGSVNVAVLGITDRDV